MKSNLTLSTLIIFLIGISISIKAQNTTKTNWNFNGIVGLNISQTSFTNWSQGGENSFVYSFFANFAANYSAGNIKVANSLKLTFGKSKLGKEPYRVNDNELFLQDVFTYNVGFKVEPYVSNIFKTILADGYDYGVTPAKKIASFFDPAYISQSAGFAYERKSFKSRLGLGIQETVTNNFTVYSDDPATPEIEKLKVEAGIESVTETKLELAKNFIYKGYYRFFGRFKEISNWDVRMDNTFSAKINEFMNVNLNVLIIYKKIESPKTQVKEALQLGFSYALF